MEKQVRKIVDVFVMFFILLSQTAYAEKMNIVEVANAIVKNVGSVGISYSEGKKGNVFVFEEYHTSRLGRLQIGVMLHRLHINYSLSKIGLEGAIQSSKPVSGEWFHTAGGENAKSAREDVAIKMLAEGEINSAEFMELVYPNIEVYGIELGSEYDVKLDTKNDSRIMYLLAIAEKYPFSQTQIKEINSLINQKKMNEAAEFMLNADSWTRQRYDALKKTSDISIKEILKQIDEIIRKAQEVNAQIDAGAKQDMEKTRSFFETASKRSSTMVKYVVDNLIDKNPNKPVAMIIGAAHTQEVIEDLKSFNVSCVQITPIDLNPNYGSLSHEQFDLKNKKKWAQTDAGTLGNLLNGHRNPPPIIETASGKSYASMYMASIIIAEYIKFGKKIPPLPDEIKRQVESLPEIKINYSSFMRDGNDIIFNALLKDTDGKEISVWTRVGTMKSENKANLTIEDKLMTEMSNIREQAKIDEKKDSSQKTKKESKESKKNGKESKKGTKTESLKLVSLNQTVKANFANSKDVAVAQKKISM